ncbi:MAG: phosphoribosyltransferase [Candidatus Thorarchaeota archaeon]
MSFQKYKSRNQAGKILAEFILSKDKQISDLLLNKKADFYCFAIPNGGVPVTEGFCSRLPLKYDILIVRKIKIPYNTEAGFGAVTTDGTVLINQPLLSQLNLSDKSIEDSIKLTKNEIKDRLVYYNKNINLEKSYEQKIKERHIFLLDDGLASGFTMLAAINMIRKYYPKKVYVAVPTAPLRTVNKVNLEVDDVFCPNVRDVMWFAVADAYKRWYDVPESEVLEIINTSSSYA